MLGYPLVPDTGQRREAVRFDPAPVTALAPFCPAFGHGSQVGRTGASCGGELEPTRIGGVTLPG
jgi:hypothetical protein